MQSAMEWGQPLNFMWFWTVPAALAVFLLSSWRKKRAMSRFGDPELVEKLVMSYEPWKRMLKRALILAALCFVVLSLCQPHFRTKEITVERKGVDVMIAVDVSQSMMAKDIAPTRLDKAKLELSTLVEKLKQDRIGVVAFAGEAFIQCPLTLDKNAVKLFISTLSPNLVPTPGTAVGAAIRVSLAAFAEKDKEDKVIILLTDGEDHGSDPKRVAKLAKDQNTRIFAIGIGTPDGSTLPGSAPQEGAKRDRQGNVILSKLDEKTLKEIAEVTGGRYFRASRGELEVEGIVQAIRQMGQKGFRKDKIIQYDENYQMLLLPALILLLLETLLSERKLSLAWFPKRAPTGVLLIFLMPFFLGFNFASEVKNEEGNRYYKKGQLGKAKIAYSAALRGEPKSPAIAFNLGNAYYKEGSFKEAVRSYAQAAKAEKDRALQPQAFYNLGNGFYKTNDLNKAAQYYKEALRLNPNDEDAKYNLELVLKKQEQNKKDPDQKKDKEKQDKQDQKDQQNKDKQENQKGGQGKDGEKGSEGKEGEQEKQDGQGGQDQPQDKNEEKEGEQQGKQGGEGEPKEQDKKDKGEGEGEQDKKDSEGEENKSDKSEGEGEEEKEKEAEGQGQSGQGEGEEKEQEQETPNAQGQEKPMTPEQMRAEQLLSALEGQEKQVMREQGSRQGRAVQNRRFVDKDW